MRKLITNDRVRVGAWVAKQVGRSTPWEKDGAIGLEEDGELIAGIVIDSHVANASASMHCAGLARRWLDRRFLFAAFDYAFNTLGIKVLINRVAGNNTDSLRFTEHIGFTRLAEIPQAWDGNESMVLFTMHRAQCRWLDILGGRYART